MAGFHNTRIYTKGDNPWCEGCMNGEKIKGSRIFKEGAVVCFCGAIPTNVRCDCYAPFTLGEVRHE